MKALFAFSRPTAMSVELGEKARLVERVTSTLKDRFNLNKDQIVGLTAVNFEGTQLENYMTKQPQSLAITVEVKMAKWPLFVWCNFNLSTEELSLWRIQRFSVSRVVDQNATLLSELWVAVFELVSLLL